MAEIVYFKPKEEVSAERNLEDFIRRCRFDLTVFGKDLPWEGCVWPGVAVFAKLGVITRKPSKDQEMDSCFVEFAKAYFRYQQGHNPTKAKNESMALRAVEAALLSVVGKADISCLSFQCLDEAAVLAGGVYSPGAAYHAGRELERLASFVSENRLVPGDIGTWKSPYRRPDDRNKTGEKAAKERECKLPSEDVLDAICEIFSNDPGLERDIFTTSICAILMCAPARLDEVLALTADCEVEEVRRDGGISYGWRFYAGKGFDGDIKWIPTAMVPVAKEAIRRVLKLSEPARQFARRCEEKSLHAERGSHLGFEGGRLTVRQAGCLVGLEGDAGEGVKGFFSRRGILAKENCYSAADIAYFMQSEIPKDFPYYDKKRGVKYSNALFCLFKNQLHGKKPTIIVSLHKPDVTFFNNDVSTRESLSQSHKNIFDRHGYLDRSGKRLRVTSHQFRHLLNTIAQRGGLSNLEIAKWSGRASVRQNRTYNHMSEDELLGIASDMGLEPNSLGRSNALQPNEPRSQTDLNHLSHGAVHVTEYGYCTHDYVISPCEKFRDCLNCSEQVCIKGESEKLDRLRVRLEQTERLWCKAKDDMESDELGADKWFQSLERDLARLRELIGLLESDVIEDGARIQLQGSNFTHLGRVLSKKTQGALEGESGHDPMLAYAGNLVGEHFG